jgi:mannose-6-phosphate isomerase-like protein (cupin superfamily)
MVPSISFLESTPNDQADPDKKRGTLEFSTFPVELTKRGGYNEDGCRIWVLNHEFEGLRGKLVKCVSIIDINKKKSPAPFGLLRDAPCFYHLLNAENVSLSGYVMRSGDWCGHTGGRPLWFTNNDNHPVRMITVMSGMDGLRAYRPVNGVTKYGLDGDDDQSCYAQDLWGSVAMPHSGGYTHYRLSGNLHRRRYALSRTMWLAIEGSGFIGYDLDHGVSTTKEIGKGDCGYIPPGEAFGFKGYGLRIVLIRLDDYQLEPNFVRPDYTYY